MTDRPEFLVRGERARLLPILSEKNKEARSLSPFLATLSVVRNYAAEIFGEIGVRIGARAKIECFTEVCFETDRKAKDLSRPDGLIVIDTGRAKWSALVEAKIGESELSAEQVERYLTIARANRVDAVITISNQFSAVPHHHPVQVSGHKTKSVSLFHFSWMHLLTVAKLQLMNGVVDDAEQQWLLNEFVRFIGDDSAGVRGFDQMPKAWKSLVGTARQGAPNLPQDEMREVTEAWQQECRDLELILSRQLGRRVEQQLSRAEKANPTTKFDSDLKRLKKDRALSISLDLPDASYPLVIDVRISRGTINQSVYIRAPGDRKSNKARLNWLLRQIPSEADGQLIIRAYWPGRAPTSEYEIGKLRDDPTLLFDGKESMQVLGFEIVRCTDLGVRMSQPRTFIQELELAVPAFYKLVVEHITEWQPAPPKIPADRSNPDDVSPSKLGVD